MQRVFCDDNEDDAVICRTTGFDPSTAAVAWLRNTTLSGNISSVSDQLNSNPAVQAVDARRPAGEASGAMTFLTNDVLSLPLIGNETAPGVIINGTRQFGVVMYVEHDALGAEEAYIMIGNLTGGASAMKLDFKKITTNFLRVDLYVDAANARRITATDNALTTASTCITLEMDLDQAAETDRVVMTVGGTIVAQMGANLIGTPDLGLGLAAGVTGNLLIGNRRDSTAASPLQGRVGRNIFFLGAKMAGATQGLLTVAARTALAGFEPLT